MRNKEVVKVTTILGTRICIEGASNIPLYNPERQGKELSRLVALLHPKVREAFFNALNISRVNLQSSSVYSAMKGDIKKNIHSTIRNSH